MAYTDRLIEAYNKMISNDYVNALIQICIALDAVAKKHYGDKPGKRIKRYLRVNQPIITRVAIDCEMYGDITFVVEGKKDLTFEEIIYALIRCALLHEGELDSRVKIVASASIGLDAEGNFLLSEQMIRALFLLLVSDPHTAQITWPPTASFSFEGKTVSFANIQGNQNLLLESIRSASKKTKPVSEV